MKQIAKNIDKKSKVLQHPCKSARIASRLTIFEAANELNLSPRMLSYYESGRYSIPYNTLVAMAKLYEQRFLVMQVQCKDKCPAWSLFQILANAQPLRDMAN
jgi:transcriptional regulator with XRE-family HTH domain